MNVPGCAQRVLLCKQQCCTSSQQLLLCLPIHGGPSASGGILLALFPFCAICIYLSWPLFTQAYTTGEMSSNAGGLIRWPVYALVPAGFALLLLQGVSELIKRLDFLLGQGEDALSSEEAMSDEQKELLALEKLAQEQAQGAR